MQFTRQALAESVRGLVESGRVERHCVGYNFAVEENVGDVRRADLEDFDPDETDIRALSQSYFDGSVQGIARGHPSSTFDPALNEEALLAEGVERNQKIVRLERIDRLLEPGAGDEGSLTATNLQKALDPMNRNEAVLQVLVDAFLDYPGERPSFAAFKSELDDDLARKAWIADVIDRLGLYHHYTDSDPRPYTFALMEYRAAEVIDQARDKGITRPFALATVLECQNNPAFFPVPRGLAHGFTVDLRAWDPPRPTVREILHTRFDYATSHVKAIVQWHGGELPDILGARQRHLAALRHLSGKTTFGDEPPLRDPAP